MCQVLTAANEHTDHLTPSWVLPHSLVGFFLVFKGPQYTSYNQGSCIRLDVLQLVDLNYCRGNNKI